ncbi:MAG: isochorismatase family protein [Acidimicrobiales bacterium]
MCTALVIVDMLNDFVEGTLANPPAKEIIEPIATIANSARLSEGRLVVYTNDAHLPSDVELRVFPPHAMKGRRAPRSSMTSDLGRRILSSKSASTRPSRKRCSMRCSDETTWVG